MGKSEAIAQDYSDHDLSPTNSARSSPSELSSECVTKLTLSDSPPVTEPAEVDVPDTSKKFKPDQRVVFTPIGEVTKVKGFTVEYDARTKMWKCVFFRLQRQVFQWIREGNIETMNQMERCKGTLIKWCQEKLFGFIAPDNDVGKVGLSCVYFSKELGGEQEKGLAPEAGWRVEFEIEHTPRGYRGRNVTRIHDRAEATSEETECLISQISFFPDTEFYGEGFGDDTFDDENGADEPDNEMDSQPSDEEDAASQTSLEDFEEQVALKYSKDTFQDIPKPRGNPNYPHPSVYLPDSDQRKKWKSRVKYTWGGGDQGGAKLIEIPQGSYNKHGRYQKVSRESRRHPAAMQSSFNKAQYEPNRKPNLGGNEHRAHLQQRGESSKFVMPNPYAPAEPRDQRGINVNVNVNAEQVYRQAQPAGHTFAYQAVDANGYSYQHTGSPNLTYYAVQMNQTQAPMNQTQAPGSPYTQGYDPIYATQQPSTPAAYGQHYTTGQDAYGNQTHCFVPATQMMSPQVAMTIPASPGIPASPMYVPNTPYTYASMPGYTFNIAPPSPMVHVAASPMLTHVKTQQSVYVASPMLAPIPQELQVEHPGSQNTSPVYSPVGYSPDSQPQVATNSLPVAVTADGTMSPPKNQEPTVASERAESAS